MSLQSILDLSTERDTKKIGVSEARLRENMESIRNLIAFYREYPDIFLDDIKGPDSTFELYYYQRIFLRIAMRHKFVYATFPRASKN